MQDMTKVKRSPAAEAIACRMLSEYSPESVEDMQNALRDIFGPMFDGLPKGNTIIIRDMNPIQGKGGVHPTEEMAQRDISETIEEIRGFEASHQMIYDITDTMLPEVDEWRSRPLRKRCPFHDVCHQHYRICKLIHRKGRQAELANGTDNPSYLAEIVYNYLKKEWRKR